MQLPPHSCCNAQVAALVHADLAFEHFQKCTPTKCGRNTAQQEHELNVSVTRSRLWPGSVMELCSRPSSRPIGLIGFCIALLANGELGGRDAG